jgi:hypothetical protein
MNVSTPKNRRNGKVARLPEPLREKINKMLDDGFTYLKIIAELQKETNPPLPYSLTIDNLSQWFMGGYQDYLRNQERAERLVATTKEHMHLAKENPAELSAGTLHAATIELAEIMDEVATANRATAAAKPDKFVRMTNALTRLSRMTLNIDQYRRIRNALHAAKSTDN